MPTFWHVADEVHDLQHPPPCASRCLKVERDLRLLRHRLGPAAVAVLPRLSELGLPSFCNAKGGVLLPGGVSSPGGVPLALFVHIARLCASGIGSLGTVSGFGSGLTCMSAGHQSLCDQCQPSYSALFEVAETVSTRAQELYCNAVRGHTTWHLLGSNPRC